MSKPAVATPRSLPGIAAAVLLACFPTFLAAFQFDLGTVEGGFDTTLSVGASWRLSDPDPTYYGIANGGEQASVNADDGNLNYLSGLNSLVAKGTSDLELKFGNFRAFTRATYFYDYENEKGDRARTPLTSAAREKVGRDFELLDYFIVGQFDFADKPLDLRLGSQVLSWGESTFIQNGINVINPIDAARIRVPGAELKEALKPVPMVSFSLGASENLTIEGFYQLRYQETEVDPPGTYFSTNDFAGQGGSRVYLGFGAIPDNAPYGYVQRGPDSMPDDEGQWGLAARLVAPGLNSTEFGLYYINYHSRLPAISARTPTMTYTQMVANIQATAGSLAQQNLAPALVAAGFPVSSIPTALNSLVGAALMGYPASVLPASLQPFYPTAQQIAAGARQTGFLGAVATSRYLIEYPEDIELYGVSFNTELPTSGVSLQGELSYKVGVPLQVDDVELLFAALSSINPTYGANNQLGNYFGAADTRIAGFKRKDVWQAQMTATKAFGPTLGASQWLLLGEVGITHVPHLPAKDELRFDGAGTFTSGSAAAMVNTGNAAFAATPLAGFADDTSWGYQIASRLEYSNVLFGMNMAPVLAFAHDVSGNTPLPLGNFVEGRKTLTVALEFSYLNDWGFEIRYVNYFGAGRYNLLGDRDFVSTSLKYSF